LIPPFPKQTLKELKLSGFSATAEQVEFIGAVMERASNLQVVVLKGQYCKDCSANSTPITSLGKSRFPSNEDEQEMVVNNLRDRFTSAAQIIFSCPTNPNFIPAMCAKLAPC
jgi:hypothetical protein